MPQLLNVLENASDESLIGLRARALDCASGIGELTVEVWKEETDENF